MVRALLHQLADVVAPPRCVACVQENSWLCLPCRTSLTFPYPVCPFCHTLSPHGFVCEKCRPKTPLTGLVAIDHYSQPYLKRGINWLKFKGVLPVASVLGNLLAQRLIEMTPLPLLRTYGVLVPIPLHSRRERQRGFNQSLAIALTIASATGMGLHPVLIRKKATWTQSHLQASLRQDNMSQAFEQVTPLPPGIRFVFLVDDVMTSGATLSSAATTLRAFTPTRHTYAIWAATLAWATEKVGTT